MQNLKGNKKAFAIFGITAFLLIACGKKTFRDKQSYRSYLHDETNNYLSRKTIRGVDYSLMYRPTDLLVLQQMDDNATEAQVENLRKKYEGYLYFNLSMSKNGEELLSVVPKNMNEFAGMVNTLSFRMRQKVHLYTQSKDTLEMTDFVYPRMYGTGKATTIMFVYPRKKELLTGDYLNFTIEDLGLMTGEVSFKVPIENITNEPILLFKN